MTYNDYKISGTILQRNANLRNVEARLRSLVEWAYLFASVSSGVMARMAYLSA